MPKHEPTDSYSYLAIQPVKCMMRADALNSHVCPLRTEMTAPSLHVYSTVESELKEFLVNKNLSQKVSTDEGESKGIIVDKCSTEDNGSKSEGIIVKKFSTEEDKS